MERAMRPELKAKLRWCVGQEDFTTKECANHFNVGYRGVRRQLCTLYAMGLLDREKVHDGESHHWLWKVVDREKAQYWLDRTPVRRTAVKRPKPTGISPVAVKNRKPLINSVFALGSA